MPDSPSAEGMTALQLKTAFDSPAVGLKSDINRLEGELEATTAAANIGASNIYAGDDSASNLQAKLAKLHSEVEAARPHPQGCFTSPLPLGILLNPID
jgi:outer membrane murein-binding lipoprotein Lpp